MPGGTAFRFNCWGRQMKISRVHAAVVAALAGASALGGQSAFAQDAALEEIVVTATRREQNLQEVPISIVAVTGESLEMRGMQNVENLNAAIPNLNVLGAGTTTASPAFRVRGIPGVGTYVDGIYQVSTAGMLTEEFVDIERLEVLRGPQGTLFGRESIGGAVRIFTKRPAEEFSGTVKGTIGSLNRHDAMASLNLPLSENVRTKFTLSDSNRDGYIRSLETGVKAGGIDQSIVSGDIVWTPTDNIDIRGQASRMESQYTEPRVADAVWLGAAWYPATAGLLYEHAGMPYSQESQMSGWPGGEVGKWENRSEITIPNRYIREQASLDVKWNINDKLSVDFLTGYTNVLSKTFIDYDNSQWGLVEDTSNSRVNLFSEEIQFSGGGDRVQWVAGIFYWDTYTRTRTVGYAMQEFNIHPLGVDGNPINHPSNDNELVARLYASEFCQNLEANPGGPPAGTCQQAMAFYKGFSSLLATPKGGRLSQGGNDGIAYFGEVTVSLTDKLTLAVGARHHDQDNYSQQMTPTNQAPLYVNQDFALDPLEGLMNLSRTTSGFDKATGRVSARYQFNDDVMGYVSYSEGFNPGGSIFINKPVTNELIRNDWTPEIISNLEVGVRSDLANGRLRLNATVFDTSWDDAIAALAMRFCFDDGHCEDTRSVVNQNVGKAHARGVELEMTYRATSNLLFNFNLGYLDTGYDEITVPTGPAAGYVAGETEFAQAPNRTINFGLQHDASLRNGGSLTTRLDYSYVSQYWRANDPTLRVAWYADTGSGIPPGFSDESGDFGTLNARLTYQPEAGNWEWAVFGTNLTNEYQLNSGFFHGIWGYDFATVGRPREWGTSLTFRF
jgi:iron complex outermembrane receptor protein